MFLANIFSSIQVGLFAYKYYATRSSHCLLGLPLVLLCSALACQILLACVFLPFCMCSNHFCYCRSIPLRTDSVLDSLFRVLSLFVIHLTPLKYFISNAWILLLIFLINIQLSLAYVKVGLKTDFYSGRYLLSNKAVLPVNTSKLCVSWNSTPLICHNTINLIGTMDINCSYLVACQQFVSTVTQMEEYSGICMRTTLKDSTLLSCKYCDAFQYNSIVVGQ